MKNYPLILSFLLPGLLVGLYFAIRGTFPFGSSSVLTVDLGQQYIDFFAYLRQTLLGHPGQLFYADGFTIQVQQTSQIEKTHRLSPCKMESPQDQLQGELDYESVHPSYLKRP
nr:YfhO family protein [Lacticaseibacillus paracasei]